MHADRQIAIWAGWIAGPAFGVAMMAAPEYFHLKPNLAALCFWGGIIVFAVTVFIVAVVSGYEREERHKAMWPIVAMAIGMMIFCVGAAAYFWPSANSEISETKQPMLDVRFESRSPYEVTEITNGRILSTVRIGLKAIGMPLSNCRVYVEKIVPETPIVGGWPILLEGGFILRPDDPEKLLDIAGHWDHNTKFRFSSPIGGGYFSEALNFLDDNIDRAIEIKVVATELQKTVTFKIWTDEFKKLHLSPL